jgi:hypothetical protein
MTKKWLWLMALVGLMGGNIVCASGGSEVSLWEDSFSDDGFQR